MFIAPKTVPFTVRFQALCVLFVWGFTHQLQAVNKVLPFRTCIFRFPSQTHLRTGLFWVKTTFLCKKLTYKGREGEYLVCTYLCISKTSAYFNFDCVFDWDFIIIRSQDTTLYKLLTLMMTCGYETSIVIFMQNAYILRCCIQPTQLDRTSMAGTKKQQGALENTYTRTCEKINILYYCAIYSNM